MASDHSSGDTDRYPEDALKESIEAAEEALDGYPHGSIGRDDLKRAISELKEVRGYLHRRRAKFGYPDDDNDTDDEWSLHTGSDQS